MFDLVRVLFFSTEVADLRASFREDYLIDQCVLVARECEKHDDPVGTAIAFANLPQFNIRQVDADNVAFWVGKAAAMHDHEVCERIRLRVLNDDSSEAGKFIVPEDMNKQLKELSEGFGPEGSNPAPTVVDPTPPVVPPVLVERDPTPEEQLAEQEAKRLKEEAKMGIATVDLPLTSKQKQSLVAGGLNTVREILAYHNEHDLEKLAGIAAVTRDHILKVISELE